MFAQEFLAPLLSDSDPDVPPMPLVVALYGQKRVGKSCFLNGFFGVVGGAELLGYLNGINIKAAWQHGDLSFRQMDQGYYAYPLGVDEEGRGGGFRHANMRWDCNLDVRDKWRDPGLDVIEHATIPHLLRADVVVTLAKPLEREKDKRYFSNLIKVVGDNLTNPSDKDRYARQSWDAPRREHILEKLLPGLDAFVGSIPSPVAEGVRSERLARIDLVNDTPRTRPAFENFKQRACRIFLAI